MKEIVGRATSTVTAAVEDCFTFLAALERYPSWNPELVRRVDVLDRDDAGRASKVHMRIHVAQSPFGKDFDFDAAVTAEPLTAVALTRLPNAPSDRDHLAIRWMLTPAAGTRVDLTFHAATAILPSFIPTFGLGNEIAEHLLDPAVTWLRAGGA
jgi:hypothetical protein